MVPVQRWGSGPRQLLLFCQLLSLLSNFPGDVCWYDWKLPALAQHRANRALEQLTNETCSASKSTFAALTISMQPFASKNTTLRCFSCFRSLP